MRNKKRKAGAGKFAAVGVISNATASGTIGVFPRASGSDNWEKE